MKNQTTAKIIPFPKRTDDRLDHHLIQAAGAFYVGKLEAMSGGACRVSVGGGGSYIFRHERVRIIGRVKINLQGGGSK
jgi:hypothetical protein